MPYVPGLAIVVMVALSTVLNELINWLLVYRTRSWTRMVEEIEKANRKLETVKQTSTSGKKDKKVKALEQNVQSSSRDLGALRSKTYMITGVLMILTLSLVNRKFNGVVVAKLPFEPPGLVQKLSHRGFEAGVALTDCAAMFVYVLAQLGVRANVAKAMGMGPSRAIVKQTGMEGWVKNQAAFKEA